jgi:nucleoside-diphosphate-sugar epimerase
LAWEIRDGYPVIEYLRRVSHLRIAITGASGFVGSHVVRELIRRGHDVIAISRHPEALLRRHPGLRVVPGDLHFADGQELMSRMDRPKVMMHLAWGGLPNYKSLYHLDPELPAQFRFLRGVVEGGAESLLVAGTCLEYGMQSGALFEDISLQPHTPYGFAKDSLRRELGFLKMERTFGLTWARLFYMFGEGQHSNSLYSRLREAVAAGARDFDMSGGEQLRDYLPVAVVASRLCDLALNHRDAGPVNVCSGQPVSVQSLVEGWIRENGWRIHLNLGVLPYPDYEPMAFWGDASKLRRLTYGNTLTKESR